MSDRFHYLEKTNFADNLRLGKDETVAEFGTALSSALAQYLPFPDDDWHIADVAASWAVVAVIDREKYQFRYFKVDYVRDDAGVFDFTSMDEVEKKVKVSYANVEDKGADDDETEEVVVPSDAVVRPSDEQRKDLPDSAFALLISRRNGLAPRRLLPHHVNAVEDGNDDESVDLPRLRMSFSRLNGVEGATKGQLRQALSHLEGHASRLRVGRFAKDAEDVAQIISVCLQELNREDKPNWEAVRAEAQRAQRAAEDRRRAAQTELKDSVVEVKTEPEPKTKFADLVGSNKTFVDAQTCLVPRLVDSERKTSYPKTMPNGKPFLAVYEAGMSMSSVINLNGYLYDPLKMADNVNRLRDAVKKAYEHGGSPLNLALKQLAGQADHPGMFDGPSVVQTCTVLLDIWMEGDEVHYAFGLLNTSIGRDVQELLDSGMPIATSMRSTGAAERKVMDENDPFWSKNKDQSGVEYLYIHDFLIKGSDLVIDPATWTYVKGEVKDAVQGVMQRLYDNVKAGAGSSIIVLEDKEMEKEALKTALKEMKAVDLKDAAPALYEAVLETVRSTELKDALDRAAALETALANAKKELASAQASGDALKAIVDQYEADKKKLEADKAEAERVAAIEDGVAKFCETKKWSGPRSKYLRKALLADATKTAADVEAANTAFEDEFGQYLDQHADASVPTGSAKTADPEVKTEVKVEDSSPIKIPFSQLRR